MNTFLKATEGLDKIVEESIGKGSTTSGAATVKDDTGIMIVDGVADRVVDKSDFFIPSPSSPSSPTTTDYVDPELMRQREAVGDKIRFGKGVTNKHTHTHTQCLHMNDVALSLSFNRNRLLSVCLTASFRSSIRTDPVKLSGRRLKDASSSPLGMTVSSWNMITILC